jgi:hypothetical protein
MRLPTASKVGLAVKCSFAWSPHAPTWPKEQFSAHADHGQAVHALAEAMAEGRTVSVSPETAPYQAPIEEALADLGARRDNVEIEQPYAVNPLTGEARQLKKGTHRGYRDALDGEITGTADLLVFDGGEVTCGDWKTGAGARRSRVGESWQMRTLGLSVGKVSGREVRIAHVHLEPNDYRIDMAPLDSWELDETEYELRRVVNEIKAGTAEPKPGHHCSDGWCPIRSVCPATKAALASIESNAAKLFPADMLRVDSPERAKAARTAIKLAEEALKTLRENVRQFLASNGSVEIAHGLHYGIVETRKEVVDLNSPEAVALIRAELGEAPLTFETSKTAIIAAAKAQQSKRGDGVKKAEEIFAKLRDMKAIRESVSAYPKEFRRDEQNDGSDSGEAA